MASKNSADHPGSLNADAKKVNKFKETITPQSAMDAYFEDMFGNPEDDPLKNLSAQQNEASHSSLSLDDSLPTKESIHKNTIVPKPKLKPKKLYQQNLKTAYVEPEPLVGNISPLIIPAAFPKLAPSIPETKLDLGTEQKQDLKPETQVKSKTRSQLDSKTALALLEKNKAKLTEAQRTKLEAKLKTLKAVKQTTSTLEETKLKSETNLKPLIKTEIKVEQEQTAQTDQKEKSEQLKLSDVQVEKRIKPEHSKYSLPDWASHRFECLIFSVAGLKLAVPLISLGAIYKIEKEIKPLVGRADWFMGLYHHLERNVRVIDTAQWVMPERYTEEVRSAYKFIIRLGGNDWGIACDAVHESIQLNPDQVKWRSERTKRAWLFGTVIDHMCALIDADTLGTMLEQQIPKKH